MSGEPKSSGAPRTLPGWIWLVLAVGLFVFAIVWLSRGGGEQEGVSPSVLDTGRRVAPPGGDFSSVQRERAIEPRQHPQRSVLSPDNRAAGGAGQAAPP
jgi:hypothetical protein